MVQNATKMISKDGSSQEFVRFKRGASKGIAYFKLTETNLVDGYSWRYSRVECAD